MKYLIACCLLLASYACTKSSGNENVNAVVEIQHFNIIIAPDLSNRQNSKLYPRPLKDEQLVRVVLKNIWPNILRHRRSENQRDKISIGFINENLISEYAIDASRLSLDFDLFETQVDRIDYIKNRSARKFSADTAAFINEYKKLSARSIESPFGADIWSYLNAGLDDTAVKTASQEFEISGKKYRNVFRNILILVTDGYIEAEMYGKAGCNGADPGQCYYLSSNRIRNFRQGFEKSGTADLQEYFESSGQRIIPAANKVLSNTEVLVLEVYDRSVTRGGVATIHPTDMEIIKTFWGDWLTKSGVRRFEIRPVSTTETEAEEVILNFIGISRALLE